MAAAGAPVSLSGIGVATQRDGTLTVGITDWAAKQMGEVVFAELPAAGTPFSERLIAAPPT